MGWGIFAPRLGIAYRVNDRLVIRTGAGMTTDPDSMRFLRDSFPIDLAPSFSGTAADTIAVDPNQNSAANPNGLPLPLTVGIPAAPIPNFSTGFASLPVSGSHQHRSGKLPPRLHRKLEPLRRAGPRQSVRR